MGSDFLVEDVGKVIHFGVAGSSKYRVSEKHRDLEDRDSMSVWTKDTTWKA